MKHADLVLITISSGIVFGNEYAILFTTIRQQQRSRMREIQAGVEEIRPGRHLFVRQWILNGETTAMASTPIETTLDTADVDLQVVLVHGMCATELQYHDMLLAIEKEMMLVNDGNTNNKKTQIHCILYDMVGCGQSAHAEDWNAYSRQEHMQDLQAIVKRGRKSLPENKKTSISTIVVAHSYAPSIVLSWLASLQQRQQQEAANDVDEYNIHGLVFLSTSLRDDALPHPDGGTWPFRYLPLSLLHCLNAHMTRDFCHRAVHARHSTLKQAMLEAPRNDMNMVRAFHRQAIWATRDDLQTALQVLTKQRPFSFSSSSSSSLSDSSGTRNTIRCLVVHGADDGIIDIRQGQKLVNLLLQEQRQRDSFSDEDDDDDDKGRNNDYYDDDDGSNHRHKLIVIPEASHMIMLEQPSLVARAILEYLQELIIPCQE
jgi:pimeloyl-ACP methyl ester carboxylesterase